MTTDGPSLSSWGFLLFPGFPMACLTSAIEPLRAANEIAGRPEFAWTLLGEAPGPVRSSANVRFDTDQTIMEATGLDALICLSPPDARFADPRAAHAALRRLGRTGVTLGGFSGGVFPLMRSGAMGAHRPSVHWCYDAAFQAEFPESEASPTAIQREKGRITVSGAGAVFDLMLRVIEERLGRPLMTEVACWFQHPFVRDENAPQATPVARTGGTQAMLPPPVREAIRIFADHIEEPVAIADVAQRLCLSERTLERAFRAATGQPPLRYYRRMRLERGRQRVLYSTDTVTEIARSVGYSTSTDFARHYSEAFGVHPADERKRLAGLRGLAGAVPPEALA
ncbi:GlxA family transcriptional regulator [Rubellimicrobium aerolatum]|uniref:GlxA family transcriptional regulator n=1 Tax=Rubellimicrobium aerolatum TaxID=490979 RepID=A0ABW0SEK8_9RHOB|nr:helix-turn-helix domain-containing protein [Rubellimicrobium aerolatum]MBP1806857.1 transcriptional regulator GlxA family with amidase domain [Rubellimicrobium aerolatum]